MPLDSAPQVTLEQWRMLVAVVDYGGYGKAAEQLQKSQSTISYSLQKLQEELGVTILKIEGRKAVLTNAGETLLRRARRLLDDAQSLNDTAATLQRGWEAELAINVDVIYPKQLILESLVKFEKIHPSIRLDIVESALSGTQDAIIHEKADIALVGLVPIGFLSNEILSIEMCCVAHRDHPLSQQTIVTEQDLKHHRQIVVRDSGVYRRMNVGWLGADQRWTVNDFSNSIELLAAGLGFAWIPFSHIESQLAKGELVKLAVDFGSTRTISISLLYPKRERTGPAAKILGELILQDAKQFYAAKKNVE